MAIICMDRFEHTHIYTTYQPYFYGRYVDDIGTFVNNVEEAELILTDLNSKHATIAFELETPNEDKFLPILDLMIRVNKEGQVERKLYCKPASKGITLNFSSHQPSTTKRAMVNAELLRAETYPTSEFVQTAVNHTKSKLLNNGYPATWTSPARTTAEQKDPSRQRITFHPEDSLPVRRLQLQDTGNLRTEQHSRSLGQPKRKNAA